MSCHAPPIADQKQRALDKNANADNAALAARLTSFEKKIYALQGRLGELTQERDDAVRDAHRSAQNSEKLTVRLVNHHLSTVAAILALKTHSWSLPLFFVGLLLHT